MKDSFGKAFKVIDLDRHQTILTCTQKQLDEVWIPYGFKLVEEPSNVSDKPEAKVKTAKAD